MERRVRGNSHARCGVGENPEIASKDYLSLFPGAFSSGTPKGEDFRIVLEEIFRICFDPISVPRPDAGTWRPAGGAILGDSFSLAWRTLDAQYWGVPQRRRRIFLIADFGGLRAGEILFDANGLSWNPPPRPAAWERIALSLEARLGAPERFTTIDTEGAGDTSR